MSYRNKTYVIFDGDNDMWAYARMKGWKSLKNIDFNFYDAHDIMPLTKQAKSEDYIKSKLTTRMSSAKQVIVLVGQSTKNLYKFVRWEIDRAIKDDLPIVVVNLNGIRSIDWDLCPPILKGKNAIHVPFKLRIIKHSLDNFPPFYKSLYSTKPANWYYQYNVYEKLGLND